MWQIIQIFGLALFGSGLLILPVLFGGAAAALSLVVALIWLGWHGLWRRSDLRVSRFIHLWFMASIAFFGIFALTANSIAHIIFGFNTFAFMLALGVYWQTRSLPRSHMLLCLVWMAAAGLLVGAVWAVYQHDFLSHNRVTAFIGGGSNLVGRIAVLLAAFSMLLLLLDINSRIKLLGYIFALSAAVLIVFYSGSRGALLALPILLILPLLFALPGKWLTSWPAWGAVLIFGLAATGTIYWLDPNGLITSTLNRIQSVVVGEGMDPSTELRYHMWQVAFQSFMEHPIIGTGWHSFYSVAQGTVLEDYAKIDTHFSFHSDIANFAVAGGIIGLILYFLLLFAPLLFWDTPRDHTYFRVRLYWAVSMPIIYIVLGLTDMVMGFDYPTMFYAFSFAIIWGATGRKALWKNLRKKRPPLPDMHMPH